MSGLDDMEADVKRKLRELQDRYRQEAEPLLKILLDIEALKPPSPVFIDIAALNEEQRKLWAERLESSGGIGK